MWMKIQIGRFAAPSRGAFRIMTAVKSPMASTQFSINVPYIACSSVFGQYLNRGFNGGGIKSGGLPHEFVDYKFMVLRQQRRNDVPLGWKIKDGEIVVTLFKKIEAAGID